MYDCMCVSATHDDATPHHFLAAIGFLSRAVEIAIRQLDHVIQAETTQFNNIHKTGSKTCACTIIL